MNIEKVLYIVLLIAGILYLSSLTRLNFTVSENIRLNIEKER